MSIWSKVSRLPSILKAAVIPSNLR
ncbi:hypothetical protein LCGC14_2605060, partial [marine sediment metagenome]